MGIPSCAESSRTVDPFGCWLAIGIDRQQQCFTSSIFDTITRVREAIDFTGNPADSRPCSRRISSHCHRRIRIQQVTTAAPPAARTTASNMRVRRDVTSSRRVGRHACAALPGSVRPSAYIWLSSSAPLVWVPAWPRVPADEGIALRCGEQSVRGIGEETVFPVDRSRVGLLRGSERHAVG